MKTFADFKRRAQMGVQFERTFVGDEQQITAIRTVNHVQSNAITFRADENNPNSDWSNRAWLYFPKSGRYRMEKGALILLDSAGHPRMILKPVFSFEQRGESHADLL